MKKQAKHKHIKMGWVRTEPKPAYFSSDFEVLNYDGSQAQKNAFYLIWNGKRGTKEEIDKTFFRYFENREDCVPAKDLFFVKLKGEYIGTVTAIYHPKNSLGHIHCLALKEKYRGKRLSYPLMYLAMKKIYDDGAKYAYLLTDDWRKPAIKVYANLKFFPVMDEFWPHKKKQLLRKWKKIYEELQLEDFKILNKNYKLKDYTGLFGKERK